MKTFLAVLMTACSLVTMWAQNPPALDANVVESIEFRGLSRVPVDTVKALVHSKAGDVYSGDRGV
jgi:outer membrane protein assembly factor BamA